MKSSGIITLAFLFLTAFSISLAEPVSREEFTSVLERLKAIEQALGVVKAEQVESIAEEALATVELSSSEKSSLIESVVKTIQTREEKAVYPWMQSDKWAQLGKGMTPEEVVAVLGRPTMNDPSLHKRIDTVYTYEGRRVATNEKITGIVRFYKGVTVEIEVPSL
jgi:outer membrane protein assembly factor BamE (lipoprotein component of BamABCDE complex)